MIATLRRRPGARAPLLALAAGGAILLATHGCARPQQAGDAAEPAEAEKPARAASNRHQSWYRSAACDADPLCRQLRRIWDEGGASEEAIRENIRAADETVTFEDVEENAEEYEGTPWAFEGTVMDIVAEERRGFGDYIVAEVAVDDDPAQLVSVRGDFKSDVGENETVYVVGYLTGVSRPRPGLPPPELRGRPVVVMSARAILTPSEARELRSSAE